MQAFNNPPSDRPGVFLIIRQRLSTAQCEPATQASCFTASSRIDRFSTRAMVRVAPIQQLSAAFPPLYLNHVKSAAQFLTNDRKLLDKLTVQRPRPFMDIQKKSTDTNTGTSTSTSTDSTDAPKTSTIKQVCLNLCTVTAMLAILDISSLKQDRYAGLSPSISARN